ncbi:MULTISPECIES: TraR/DksA C4-type zinc finger protein [Pseudomonas]
MPIPEQRRVAIPGVQLCAQCQTHREKRSRR